MSMVRPLWSSCFVVKTVNIQRFLFTTVVTLLLHIMNSVLLLLRHFLIYYTFTSAAYNKRSEQGCSPKKEVGDA